MLILVTSKDPPRVVVPGDHDVVWVVSKCHVAVNIAKPLGQSGFAFAPAAVSTARPADCSASSASCTGARRLPALLAGGLTAFAAA